MREAQIIAAELLCVRKPPAQIRFRRHFAGVCIIFVNRDTAQKEGLAVQNNVCTPSFDLPETDPVRDPVFVQRQTDIVKNRVVRAPQLRPRRQDHAAFAIAERDFLFNIQLRNGQNGVTALCA